jgi:regulator of nucleoside diphosphate kinase
MTTNINSTKEIILSKGDYVLLLSFIKNHASGFSNYSLKKLASELQSAKVVPSELLPKDSVRLNSRVKIREQGLDDIIEVKLVMPSEANIVKRNISIFAPLGSALIGYRKKDVIEWEMPAGIKKFTIVDVKNDE